MDIEDNPATPQLEADGSENEKVRDVMNVEQFAIPRQLPRGELSRRPQEEPPKPLGVAPPPRFPRGPCLEIADLHAP